MYQCFNYLKSYNFEPGYEMRRMMKRRLRKNTDSFGEPILLYFFCCHLVKAVDGGIQGEEKRSSDPCRF